MNNQTGETNEKDNEETYSKDNANACKKIQPTNPIVKLVKNPNKWSGLVYDDKFGHTLRCFAILAEVLSLV